MKRFTFTITIECLDPQTEAQALNRLHNWFETHGHTCSSHGFEPLHAGFLPRTARFRSILQNKDEARRR